MTRTEITKGNTGLMVGLPFNCSCLSDSLLSLRIIVIMNLTLAADLRQTDQWEIRDPKSLKMDLGNVKTSLAAEARGCNACHWSSVKPGKWSSYSKLRRAKIRSKLIRWGFIHMVKFLSSKAQFQAI